MYLGKLGLGEDTGHGNQRHTGNVGVHNFSAVFYKQYRICFLPDLLLSISYNPGLTGPPPTPPQAFSAQINRVSRGLQSLSTLL